MVNASGNDDSSDADEEITPRSMHERAYMQALGLRVRALREERNLTQQALAQSAGIATDMVSRLENGHYSSPGLRTLLRIAAGMGTQVASLLPDMPTVPRGGDLSARARLHAVVAKASTREVELVADLASAVVGRPTPER
jgi:transcriptional regulator with XRE-family HTH domain